MATQSITLNTGAEMPVLGLGTWQSPPGKVGNAVKTALENGYKHIDCAYIYQNEKEIGPVLDDTIGTIIQRQDLFVTSKLAINMMQPKHVKECLEVTLKDLHLEYLDLYLVHWPHAVAYQGPLVFYPKDEQGNVIFDNIDYKDTWRVMEELVDEGLVKAIGVSNFNTIQVDDVLQNCSIKPAVSQFEIHPYMTCNRWVNHCHRNGIAVTAYSPLASPDRPGAAASDCPILLDNPALASIAKKYGKTPAQVCIRFAIDRGLIVIPKSVTPSRIIANSQVFDFKLSDEEIKSISALNKNLRYTLIPKFVDGKELPLYGDHPHYSFDDPNYE
ncbi:Alcohol dehydrogenase [NADP(+)] [Trichoplax sp. H2]|nr:Alcohol dehydrogenase [NADP(+)] [Trichoplax sp. H2]|eukprot:RDD40221.1 Alcohol dehydrogenase [NADP(+)] [Trichoplax sp. H2]